MPATAIFPFLHQLLLHLGNANDCLLDSRSLWCRSWPDRNFWS